MFRKIQKTSLELTTRWALQTGVFCLMEKTEETWWALTAHYNR